MGAHDRDFRRPVAITLWIFLLVLVTVFVATFSRPLMTHVARNPVLARIFGIGSSPATSGPGTSERRTSVRAESGESRLASPRAETSSHRLSGIGRETGVVFSPDFSEPGNRALYEALGFAYFEDTSWARVLGEIRAFNAAHRAHPLRVLILETHGTEGNGLKLQGSKDPAAGRSYVSVGGLQQSLEGTGVRTVILSACNAGRLFRPKIYERIDRHTRNHLFLPATEGFVDATEGFDPRLSAVSVVRRSDSNLESLVHASTSELAPSVRAELAQSSRRSFDTPRRFAVSTMLIQILIQDQKLHLRRGGFVESVSRNDLSTAEIEALFHRFLVFLETVAEGSGTSGATGQGAGGTMTISSESSVRWPEHSTTVR